MKCQEIEELLSELIDDELPEKVKAGIEAHLADCPDCSRLHHQMKRTVRFVRANADEALAPGTAGGWYADFTRAILNPDLGKTGAAVWEESGRAPKEGAQS